MNTTFSDKKGFTLVEVIIVMAVMSIVMMAVMSLYIPVQRSAVVQSQVADIQGGMRVALDTMSKDFRNAGFLIDDDPIELVSAQEIIIRTRAGAVGIVSPAGIPPAEDGAFILSDAEQGRYFPLGTYVGVFSPMVRNAYVGGIACKVVGPDPPVADKRLIVLQDKDNNPININAFETSGQTALMLVPLENGTVPTANTIKSITYTFDEETINGKVVKFLRRTENGSSRFLARGVSGSFEPKTTKMADGNFVINRVQVRMTGETVEMSKDAIGSQKTRTLDTVFTLRNI